MNGNKKIINWNIKEKVKKNQIMNKILKECMRNWSLPSLGTLLF